MTLLNSATGWPPAWQASTPYTIGQFVSFGGAVLKARANHTSGTTIALANWSIVKPPTISQFEVYGHSYSSGTGSTGNNNGYDKRLGQLLGVPKAAILNYGVGGSVIGYNSNGSFIALQNRIATPVLKLNYYGTAQIISLNWGVNDVTNDATSSWGNMIIGLQTAICQCLAAAKMAADDATVVGSGGSISAQSTLSTSFTKNLYHTQTVGNTITINVPSSFPGGEIDLYALVTGATNGGGGQYTITLDGVSQTAWDFTTAATTLGASTNYTEQSYRLTGVSAGSHTIVLTLAAASAKNNVWFDGWSIVAPTNQPLILVHNIARNNAGAAGPQWTNSNAAIASLVAGFTSSYPNVILADMDTVMAPVQTTGGYNPSNTLHPSDYGYSLMAQALAQLVLQNFALVPPPDALLSY